MMKYLATISVILLGCSLDGSSWEMIGILALVSAVLIGAAVVEEDTTRARKHLASAGQEGKGKKNEARRDLRTAG
jgi:hypothetical protein